MHQHSILREANSVTREALICAVVVAYYPDEEFAARLAELLPQVSALVVVDNTPTPARKKPIESPYANYEKWTLIENDDNLGVGAALNQGLELAAAWNCDWLLTLDQDSICNKDIVQTLRAVMTSCPSTTKVIGSNYFDPRNHKTKVPEGETTQFLEQKTVITSGSLVDVHFALEIGGFRADYFIDQLDHEFCLRARSYGGVIVITRKSGLVHSVGEANGVWLPILGRLPDHPQLRKYYLARNALKTITTYWRIEPNWCAQRSCRLFFGFFLMVLMEHNRLKKTIAFLAGLADSIRNRMGRCPYRWLDNKNN